MAISNDSILGLNNTTYTRRDVESIYEYLKAQAKELSNGKWTDFSSGDIGSVLLGLMAYLADCNNFQIDKTASELFLDTAVERSSIMSQLKLIGYKPRHYESATTTIKLEANAETSNSTTLPRYTTFTNLENTVTYTLLEPMILSKGVGSQVAYEGTRVSNTYTYSQITTDGKIYLPDYKIGTNTVQLYIPTISNGLITQVDDVRFYDGAFVYSVHVDEYARVYIQLPSYWSDLLTISSYCVVSYLISSGEAGRVGENVLTTSKDVSLIYNYTVTNTQSVGGYFPETTDELKITAPRHARTMNTIVTKRDFEELALGLSEIASIKCGDYNDEWTGYTQPDDAYKCKVLVVPSNPNEISIYKEDEETHELMPTVTLSILQEYVDQHRLASLMITYEDPIRLTPNIKLNIYTDPNDLRTNSVATTVESYMKALYGRESLEIGESLYGSVIGRDLLNAFPYINYLEVVEPDSNITCAPDEYIDMNACKFKIYVNDELIIDEWES
jgi:hypothetical protein